jgi:hypothetical protein
MDIISHGLWAAAAYKGVNKKRADERKFSVRLAAFFGIFPDLFAFGVSFIYMFYSIAIGKHSFSDFPRPENIEPAGRDTLWIFNLSHSLYDWSHSLIIFALVFLVVYLIRRRPAWELCAWLLHILMDVPTHTYLFFPTPLFWPLSHYYFSGISWASPWFMVTNYTLLILTFLQLRKKKKVI